MGYRTLRVIDDIQLLAHLLGLSEQGHIEILFDHSLSSATSLYDFP
jgi:hypothetical protein